MFSARDKEKLMKRGELSPRSAIAAAAEQEKDKNSQRKEVIDRRAGGARVGLSPKGRDKY